MRYRLLAIGLLSCLFSYSWADINVDIKHHGELNQTISAASGIEKWGDKYYVISDDSMSMAVVNSEFKVLQLIPLEKEQSKLNTPIKKSQKKDLESMAIGNFNDELLLIALGSGSKKNRHLGYIYNLKNQQVKTVDLQPLYQALKMRVNLAKDAKINIEGFAITQDKVYIANRGNAHKDIIFVLSKDVFWQLLNATKPSNKQPEIQVVTPNMPQIGRYASTFSGLDYDANDNSLLFTTSIELTDDAYHDGLVLGSFIGKIALDKLKNNVDLTNYSQLLFDEHGVIQTKIESIIFSEKSAKGASVFLVSDNDGKPSEFYQVEIY
ncbi:MAG: hypothetical protein O2809_06615 [Proteobacteria bacterium]|nr:hypothetical protein [Pseudomonadota bacterium]